MLDTLTLYGNHSWTSPYVFSSYVTLKEKGLPFDLVLFDLDKKEHLRPEYRDPSITGRVPALRHGAFWVAESSAIDEYLEEAFPPPAHPRLYPADPKERARVRMVQALVRSDFMPVRAERPTSSFFHGEAVKPLTAEGAEAAARLVRIAGALVTAEAGFVASHFTPADADLALLLMRLVRNGDPVPATLAGYARRIFDRPSVKAWLANTAWKA